MTTYKIGQYENGRFVCWYAGNKSECIKSFLQYMLDSLKNPESFYIVNTSNGVTYGAYEVATQFFELHKRTFKEKMEA